MYVLFHHSVMIITYIILYSLAAMTFIINGRPSCSYTEVETVCVCVAIN